MPQLQLATVFINTSDTTKDITKHVRIPLPTTRFREVITSYYSKLSVKHNIT